MANYNADEGYINSLKASFCRQHFQDLLYFLRDFDISESEGRVSNDTLKMGFLLQAYDNRDEKIVKRETGMSDEEYQKLIYEKHQKFLKNIEELKATCKWKLDIEEDKVFIAVEEFFSIISQKDDLSKLVRILLENISTEKKATSLFNEIFPTEDIDKNNKLYQFEDGTTQAVLNYFGIPTQVTELGKQSNAFARFILKAIGSSEQPSKLTFPDISSPETQFIQAFQLLAAVRNWTNHKFVPFIKEGDYSYHLCRFVIFTHIGITYLCRRLWNNSDAALRLEKNGYKAPNSFDLKETELQINIKANEMDHKICKCNYSICGTNIDKTIDALPNREISFSIKVKKYEQYNISFECNGEQYIVLGRLNYYSWNPILNIVVRPPKVVSYIFKGIAGGNDELEKYIGEIFAKYLEIETNPKASEEKKRQSEKILNKLGNIEPQLQRLQDLVVDNSEDTKEIKKDTKEIQKEIQTIHNEILPLLTEYDQNLNAIKDGLDEILINIRTIVGIDNERRTIADKTTKMKQRNNYCIFLGLFFLLAFCVLCFSLANDISTNITWLKYRWIYLITAFLGVLLTYFVVRRILKLSEEIKNNKIKRKGLLSYGTTGIVLLFLIGSPFLLKYQTNDSLVNKYDFAVNNYAQNQIVASFLEKRIASSDNYSIIIKLLSYYLIVNNNNEKAKYLWERIGENAKDHPEEVIKAAEMFMEIRDYTRLNNALKICSKEYKDSSVVVMRLIGLMKAGGYGVKKSLKEGLCLLDSASLKGDIDATYWIGHIASSIEFQQWTETDSGPEYCICYDLLSAISKLRQVSSLPKASLELGDIYADLNMNDSAEYYYLKAISINENCLDAKYQLGRLYDKLGKKDNVYMSEVISKNYAPAMLYMAERDSDHISAIELYKIFEDSIKSRRYLKKYREDYRYIRPIVFEYIAAHDLSNGYNGLDSAYNYLLKSRPNGNFNMEFVKGIKTMTSKDSTIKKDSWKYFRESANKGCLYAQMICHYKDIMQILRSGEKGEKLSPQNKIIINNKLDSLDEIGDEIPFSNVLISWITGESKLGLDDSEELAHKALIRGHLAGIMALSRNAMYYKDFINEIIPIWDDEHPRSFHQPIQFNHVSSKDLHVAKGFWVSAQLGLRYSPTMENKMGFITIGSDLRRIIESVNEPKNDYPIEYFHFWCDVAIANHDYINECNFLMEIVRKFFQKGGSTNDDACIYFVEEPYTKKLINAASLDMGKYPKATYREFLTSSIKIYERLTGHYNHPNDSIPIFIKPQLRFASMPVLSSKYEDLDILYECSEFFSPYGLKIFESRFKDLPKKQIIDFYGYDIYQ